jgi:LacI family transcriptional regulator
MLGPKLAPQLPGTNQDTVVAVKADRSVQESPRIGENAQRPTMKHVALKAGVSLKTVSRVVNDAPNVRPDLADSVLKAIAELGFRRNDIARNLRAGRATETIGLVIEDLANPFYSTIASAVSKVAREHGSLLITSSLEENRAREREFILELCSRRLDGLLIVPAGSDHAFLRAEMEMGLPAVFLDRPPTGVLADAVLVDNAGGAQSGIELLLAHGHTRIAILLDSLSIYTMRERLSGAQAALVASNTPYDEALLRVDIHESAAAARAATDLIRIASPATAFFCGNNRITVGVLRALWEQGSDAEIVGFDDFELSYLMPRPVTVIAYDNAELGRTGAELLYRRIAGDRSWPKTVVLPTRLIEQGIRGTSSRLQSG